MSSYIDTMSSSSARNLGKSGETSVSLFFKNQGFSVIDYPQDEDLGTDLILDVRAKDSASDRAVDLSYSVRCQVKTGDSYFARTVRSSDNDGNEVDGWWYTCDARHRNYWTRYADKFFLILQNPEAVDNPRSAKKFWQWLDDKDLYVPVASRGNEGLQGDCQADGYRIFVPSSQIVNKAFCDQLIKIAKDRRIGLKLSLSNTYSFEIAGYPLSQHARYALLLPDLVKPHENRGVDHAISWAEALALCVCQDSGRWSNSYFGFADKFDEVLSIEEAKNSEDAGWRFTGWYHALLFENDLEGFEKLVDLPSELQAAKIAVLAARAYWDQRFGDAVSIVDGALASIVDLDGIDKAWLLIQKGNSLSELARWDEAKEIYSQSQQLTKNNMSDDTAKLLHYVATVSSFNLTTCFNRDIGSFVAARDNSLSRFSLRRNATTLDKLLDESFNGWSPSGGTTFAATDTVIANCQVSANVGLLSGDIPAFRHALSNWAMVSLSMRGADEEESIGYLSLLLRSGDQDHLKQALRKARRTFAPSMLRSFMDSLSPNDVTPMTVRAYLDALQECGEYLGDARVAEWLDFLSSILSQPEHFVERYSTPSGYRIWPAEAVKCLGSMRYQLSAEQLEQIVSSVCAGKFDLSTASNQVYNILKFAVENDLSIQVMEDCMAKSEIPEWLQSILERVLYKESEYDREAIHQEILAGDLAHIDCVVVDAFRVDEVDAIVRESLAELRSISQDSGKGCYAYRAMDYGYLAATFLVCCDNDVYWDGMISFLETPCMESREKVSAAKVITAEIMQVSVRQAEKILDHEGRILRSLNGDSPWANDENGRTEVRAMLVAAHGRVGGFDETMRAEMAVMKGFDECNVQLLKYTSNPELTLFSLCSSEDLELSYKAFETLVSICCEDESRYNVYAEVLSEWCLNKGGDCARGFLNGIYDKTNIPAEAERLLIRLEETHPSAIIRHYASIDRMLLEE